MFSRIVAYKNGWYILTKFHLFLHYHQNYHGAAQTLDLVKKNCNVKFDESIDVSLRINLKQSKGGDFSLRSVVNLPNGSGKKNKVAVICESDKTRSELLERALKLFKKLRMKIINMDPLEHDKNIAYVSHLSHVSSFMLAKTVLEKKLVRKNIFDLAGSGFESTVRLAKSSPETWGSIFNDNKSNLVEALNEYIDNLKYIKSLIEKSKSDLLFDELSKINLIRKILSGIKIK